MIVYSDCFRAKARRDGGTQEIENAGLENRHFGFWSLETRGLGAMGTGEIGERRREEAREAKGL